MRDGWTEYEFTLDAVTGTILEGRGPALSIGFMTERQEAAAEFRGGLFG